MSHTTTTYQYPTVTHFTLAVGGAGTIKGLTQLRKRLEAAGGEAHAFSPDSTDYRTCEVTLWRATERRGLYWDATHRTYKAKPDRQS